MGSRLVSVAVVDEAVLVDPTRCPDQIADESKFAAASVVAARRSALSQLCSSFFILAATLQSAPDFVPAAKGPVKTPAAVNPESRWVCVCSMEEGGGGPCGMGVKYHAEGVQGRTWLRISQVEHPSK